MDDEEVEQPSSSQPAAKVGTKKQKKLEEKQARKAQREVRRGSDSLSIAPLQEGSRNAVLTYLRIISAQMEMEEREERKRMQELREQERRQEEEKERLLEQRQVLHTPPKNPTKHTQLSDFFCCAVCPGGR